MTAPVQQTVRPLPVICADAARVPCPQFRARFVPCVTGSLGTTGCHVARFAVAYRAELVTAAEMLRVTRIAQVFTGATVVFTSGGAS
jgi:hypothetical protein